MKMAQIRVMADALDPGACRKRRVHQHHGGTQARQIIGDGLGVVTGDRRVREQSGKQPGANGGDLVQVQGIPRTRAIGALAERAFGHDGEHAGASRGLQHDVAGPDGGGLQRGVGERQGGGELLQGRASCSSDRLVWDGSRAARVSSMASMAVADPGPAPASRRMRRP